MIKPRLRAKSHKLPYRAVYYAPDYGYAWQDEDFLERKRDLARRAAKWRMQTIGITMCGYFAYEHPCVLLKW